MPENKPVIIVARDGQTAVVTGWRAWLVAIGAILGGIAGLLLVAMLFFGLAMMVGVLLVVAVPAAIILALAARFRGAGNANSFNE